MTRRPDISQLPPRHLPGSDRWWVYAHRSDAGDVLYIGCTRSPRSRQSNHRSRSAWWPQVAAVTIEGHFGSRRDALDFEANLIGEIDPPNNVLRTEREHAMYSAAFTRKPTVAQLQDRVAKYEALLAKAQADLAAALAEAAA